MWGESSMTGEFQSHRKGVDDPVDLEWPDVPRRQFPGFCLERQIPEGQPDHLSRLAVRSRGAVTVSHPLITSSCAERELPGPHARPDEPAADAPLRMALPRQLPGMGREGVGNH